MLSLFAGRKKIWAALCTARANGSKPGYDAGIKHALTAMVYAREQDVQDRVSALLNDNGWKDIVIDRLKQLDEPFHSEDPVMIACYEAAKNKDGGIVIYSDPVPDA